MADFEKILKETSYPGRGIMIGRSADGTKAVTAYFIMGRSVNSRNRIFVEDGEGIRTQAFDPSKMENGDQTDTIYEGLDKQYTFEQALRSREFEPDAPNYTPRISGVMHVEKGKYSYAMSILKSDQGDPSSCLRYTFAYENPKQGEGRFISTYKGDGNPLPSFEGEPKALELDGVFTGDIDTFTDRVWAALNEDNKVSLFVRFIDITSGAYQTRIVNKNQ